MPEEVYLQISGSPQDICMTVYHSYSQQSFPFYTVCAQNQRAYDSMLERERAWEQETYKNKDESHKNMPRSHLIPKSKEGKKKRNSIMNKQSLPIFKTIAIKLLY